MAITAAQLEVKFLSSGAAKVKGELRSLGDAVKSTQSGFNDLYESVGGFATKSIAKLTSVADGIGKVSLGGLVTVFTKGAKAAWSMVDSVEQSTIALRAFEKDGAKVDKVLKDLLAFARSDQGKLFMRQELFHAAQALKVAGAETENLTRYVEIMSRSVSSGMGSWVDLERVIGRVGATGRLTGTDFEMLQQMGFQLDTSLRNTTVTWEQLFDVLDRGIGKIDGQSGTLQGKMTTLNTAIRGVGTALLDINSETSKFNEGGLGAQMVTGIDLAIVGLGHLQEVAKSIGQVASTVVQGMSGLIEGFQMLPENVQSWTLKIVGAVAAFGMFRQAISLTTAAMRLMGLSSFTALFSPLGLAITAVAVAGGYAVKSFMDQKRAAENLKTALDSLNDTYNSLLLSGLDEAANRVKLFHDMMEDMPRLMEGQRMALLTNIFPDWYENSPDPTKAPLEWLADMRDAYSWTAEEANKFADAQKTLGDALADPRVDADALMDSINELYNSFLSMDITGDEFLASMIDLASRTGEFRLESDAAAEAMDDLNESMEQVVATAADFDKLFADLPAKLDDLRIDGKGQIADDIDTISKAIDDAFVIKTDTGVTGASPLQPFVDETIRSVDVTEDELARLGTAWDRIQAKMETGDFDNARIMADILGILQNTDLDAGAKVDAIEAMSNALVDYKANVLDVTEQIKLLNEVARTDDPLSQWNLSGHATEASTLAENIQNLTAVMGDAYRIVVQNTDAIGQQMQSLDDWATNLIGAAGTWAEIDDLLGEGRISLDQYTAAQEAQTTIAAANTEIQRDLLAIQAQQAPVLAQNADAMQEYIRQLRDMNDGTREGARDQLAALALMDSATQSRLQGFIELGGQLKEMGPAGAASLQTIVDGMVAMGDPMVAVLENLGLIKRELDGSYSVNIDGFEDANNDIVNLTNSIDALTTALGGVPPVRLGVEGKDEVDAARQSILDIANAPSKKDFEINVTVPGAGSIADSAGEAVRRILGNMGVEPEPVNQPITLGPVDESALDALRNQPPVEVPISLVMQTTGAGAAGSVAGAAQSALGQAQQSIQVSVTADTSDVDAAIARIEEIAAPEIVVTISANTDALDNALVGYGIGSGAGGNPGGGGASWTAPSLTVNVDADTTSADTAITDLIDTAIPDKTLYILGDATDALSAIDSINTAVLDDKTVMIYGDNTAAWQAINNINNAVVNDKYMTIHVSKSGDVSEHARGGFVRSQFQLVGEEGPELVSLPPGSYVHTAAETRGMMAANDYSGYGFGSGGGYQDNRSFQVTIQVDATGKDVDEEKIAQMAGERTMTALKHVMNDHRRGQGLVA